MKILLIIIGTVMLTGCYSAKSLGDNPNRQDKYLFIY
jgi:hypothetical protein